MGTLESPR